MFASVEKTSLAELVFRQLRDGILEGRIRQGEKLPAERLLAEKLGVNRGAVREGLKRLQQAELVQIRHGGATEVRDWKQHAGLELLPQLLLDAHGAINTSVARGIMSLRSQLAPGLAKEAARHANAEDIAALRQICSELRQAEDRKDAQRIADQFWDRLVDASHNLGYRLAFNSLRRTYSRLMPLLSAVLEVEFRDVESLEGLTDALRDGTPKAAANYAEQHVTRGHAAIETLLSSLDTQGDRQ